MSKEKIRFITENTEKEDDLMIKKIETIAQENEKQILEQWRYFRQNPEVGMAPETAKHISEQLKNLGFEVQEGIAKTGIVATLQGGKEAKIIAFKGNLDAVPVQDEIEDTNIHSKKSGASHTCGHAGEMATMLGAAKILSQIPVSERGTFKLIFQPNEERSVDIDSYALKMTKEGALEGIDAVIELHPTTLFPQDTLLSPEGRLNAASGRYKVTVHLKEADIFTGKTPDANTALSLVSARMGKHEPKPEEPKDILTRTPYHTCIEGKTLEEAAREFNISPDEFVSYKIILKGAGGHAGVSQKAPNLNLIGSEIVAELYGKYGNSLLTFSKSAGEPAYNTLTTQTELWVSVKGKDKAANFQQDIQQAVEGKTKNLLIEKEWQQEQVKDVPFSSQAESWSTVRIGTDDYIPARKDIFVSLREALENEMLRAGLTKPKSVGEANDKMACPEGEWRIYYHKGTPPQFNSPELVQIVEQAAKEFGISEFNKKSITSGSDFSFMKKPNLETAQILWGCVSKDEYPKFTAQNIGHHHPKFKESEWSVVNMAKIISRAANIYWDKTQGE